MNDVKSLFGNSILLGGVVAYCLVALTSCERQQQQVPATVYDVAQHAGGGGAAAQSAEYSHLAPRNDGRESNNFYDLGPQQRNGRQHGAIDQSEYEVTDSSV